VGEAKLVRTSPLIALVAIATGALPACHQRSPGVAADQSSVAQPTVIDIQWTDDAARRTEALDNERINKGQRGFGLPQVWIYDAAGRMIFHQEGGDPREIENIGRAVLANRPIPGPSFSETMSDFQTRDGRSALSILNSAGKVTVIDYWAEWCVPCKLLEKKLLAWAATQPRSVQLVRAETDLTKLARARGEKVYKLVKGKDGKTIKVEM